MKNKKEFNGLFKYYIINIRFFSGINENFMDIL